jgi:pimeloyl-ACP methyl ester carboxylesterase
MLGQRTVRRIVLPATFLLLVVLTANHRGCSTTLPEDSTWVQETTSIQKQVEVDGVELRVLDTGKGPPIVLIHGFLDSSFTWRKLIPLLKDRFRVIALDLPGFGYSDKPGKAFSFAEYARVVVGVLDELDVDRAFIVGNSMGGSTALRVAIDFPERVLGLVPIDPGTPRDDDEPKGAIDLLRMSLIGEFCVHTMGPWIYDRVWSSMVTKGYEITGGEMDEMYGLLNTPGARSAALKQVREIRSNPVPWEDMKGVRAPTLLIWGRQDTVVPLKYGERLNTYLPDSRMVVLEDAGHLPQWEKPEEVAKLVSAFFEEVDAPQQVVGSK